MWRLSCPVEKGWEISRGDQKSTIGRRIRKDSQEKNSSYCLSAYLFSRIRETSVISYLRFSKVRRVFRAEASSRIHLEWQLCATQTLLPDETECEEEETETFVCNAAWLNHICWNSFEKSIFTVFFQKYIARFYRVNNNATATKYGRCKKMILDSEVQKFSLFFPMCSSGECVLGKQHIWHSNVEFNDNND